MKHEPELNAAAYLAGELDRGDRVAFEEHLLECEECWAEVEAGRRGMLAAEQARELAPMHLRARIRESLAQAESPRPPRRSLRLWAAAASLVAIIGISAAVVSSRGGVDETPAIQAAVAGYSHSRLPGADTPNAPAPDLSELRLTEVGAGAGRLAGLPVNAYAFRDEGGRRLMVYVGQRSFPMPSGAQPLEGEEGPWIAERDGVAILCARYPHELLIVGKDKTLVHAAAEALDAV